MDKNKLPLTLEAKDKLLNLEKHLAIQPANQHLPAFGKILIRYLGPYLSPFEFYQQSLAALSDLKKGTNCYTGAPLECELAGSQLFIFELLEAQIPQIAEVIFPEYFARSIRTYLKNK